MLLDSGQGRHCKLAGWAVIYLNLENYLSDNLGVKVDLVHKAGLKPRIGERMLAEVVYL